MSVLVYYVKVNARCELKNDMNHIYKFIKYQYLI